MHTQPLCAALLAAWTTVAAQQPVPQPTPPPSTDPVQELRELKASYMACDKAATHRALPFAEAVACSMVSEALLRKAFGGDFHALLAWWRVAKNERERETWSE